MRKKTERLSFWVPIFGATAFAVGYGEAGGFGLGMGVLLAIADEMARYERSLQ